MIPPPHPAAQDQAALQRLVAEHQSQVTLVIPLVCMKELEGIKVGNFAANIAIDSFSAMITSTSIRLMNLFTRTLDHRRVCPTARG